MTPVADPGFRGAKLSVGHLEDIEAELLDRTNRVRCAGCGVVELVDGLDTAAIATVGDLPDHLVPGCGCDDPSGQPLIVTSQPLGLVDDVDDEHLIRWADGTRSWEYQVDAELLERLTDPFAYPAR